MVRTRVFALKCGGRFRMRQLRSHLLDKAAGGARVPPEDRRPCAFAVPGVSRPEMTEAGVGALPLLQSAENHPALASMLTCTAVRPFRAVLWGRSSAGRAPAWHAGGQGFEPPRLHHPKDSIAARSVSCSPATLAQGLARRP